MSNYHLHYGISRRTPASPKVLKGILEAQATVNRVCTWTHEKLSLAAPREPGRASFAFSFGRFGFASGPMNFLNEGIEPRSAASVDGATTGATRVRDNLWNAHLVAAFLTLVSRMHPELLLELRDEGGFVVPGAVLIRGGMVEANREFLNRERARVLEMTGDRNAGAPFVWAETQGLAGNFFHDVAASEYAEMPEIQALGAGWNQLEATSLSAVASHVVERAITAPVPATA